MTVGLPPDRASRVRRSFLRTGLDVSVWRSPVGAGRPASAFFLAGMIAVFLTVFLDWPLWTRTPLPRLPELRLGGPAVWLLLLLLLANGVLIESLLRRRTRAAVSIPFHWRALRFIVAALPVLSFCTPALWRWLGEREESGGLRRWPRLDLSTGEALPSPALPERRLLWSALPGLWIGTGFLVPLLWVVWIGSESLYDPDWRRLAMTVCVLLHGTAAVSLACYFRDVRRRSQAEGWRASLLSWLPLLALFPFPLPFVPVLAMPFLDPSEKSSLVTSVYHRRWNASRLPLWSVLETSLSRRWREVPWWRQWRRPLGLERPVQAGLAERALLDLYRWKGLLAAVDAVALIMVLSVAGLHGRVFSPDGTLLLGWAWVSVVLALTGLAGEVAVLGARLLRASVLFERLGCFPWGRALLYPHAAFLAGLVAGQALVAGWTRELCLWVAMTLALGTVVGVLTQVLFPNRLGGQVLPLEPRNLMENPMLLLLLLVVEMVLLLTGGSSLLGTAVRTVAVLSPLWALLSGLALGKWLLRPYGWEDLWRRDVPRSRRAWLGLLAVTLLLPLGGLLIPLWIGVRQRLAKPMGYSL